MPLISYIILFCFTALASAQSSDPLQKYTISAPGINATFIPYGARLTNLYVNDKNGKPQDVVLGFDDAADYIHNDETVHTFLGPIVGRYANRIKNGTFTVQGTTSHIPENDNMGHDTLHGGKVGYDQRNWTVVSANTSTVTFSLLDKAFEGFPGNVITYATYTVSAGPRWTSRIVSMPLDEPTPIMLANHVYWNLGAYVDTAGTTVLNDTLHMPYAARYVEIDNIEVPTGAIGTVAGTSYDFTSPKQIGRDIESAVNGCGYNCTGYDNAFILDRPRSTAPESADLSMLTMSSISTGIQMDIYTNQQSLQIYTCDNTNGTIPVKQSQQHADKTTYVEKFGYKSVYEAYFDNSTAPRCNTDIILTSALRAKYSNLHLTTTPTYSANLLAFAAAGHASASPSSTSEDGQDTGPVIPETLSTDLKWRRFLPPARRISDSPGTLVDSIKFGRFIYSWSDQEYIIYTAVGTHNAYDEDLTYILGASAESNDALLLAVGRYWHELHNEVLVFDSGYWSKSHKLWETVQNSTWDDVILDPEMKQSIVGEMNKFFGSQKRYQRLKVPWKRGIIYYGPPGNGKTISIKAMMHTLYHLPSPIPTLYVRSLSAYGGPEYAIASIFSKARQQSPCLLVFEDLDSIVTDGVRSYFLNEVDGLQSNDGILMVGSTNHLERLDPGIAKRPSRFDRKYLFPNPGMEERILYCEFWRKKLGVVDDEDDEASMEEEPEVEFPKELCKAIAGITDGFSFAYIQEAFVASLLAIAAIDDEYDHEEALKASELGTMLKSLAERVPAQMMKEGDLNRFVLWRQMKKQVKILREELQAKDGGEIALGD
ncbi:MAG: hypothetical protein Q9220_003195 [cf. Caloplaca sp. 1 TL-2023]